MTQRSSISQFFKVVILLELVFIMAVFIWYAPIAFKGYPVVNLWSSSSVARNLAEFGIFGAESDLNILLAPSLVEEQAHPYLMGGKLTPLVIAQIFKIIGVPEYDNLIFVSIIILALALLFFTITVYYLFDLKTAAVFAFIYILLPFNWWQAPYNFANYEVALLFLSLFFLFFFLGWKSFSSSLNEVRSKNKYIFMFISGIFLALAGMAKEALFVLGPVLFIYLLLKREKKYLLALFIPFFIIVSFFWLPDILGGENVNREAFIKDELLSDKPDFIDWDHLNHIFPDPYTYHFDQQSYLDQYQSNIRSSDIEMITRIKMSKAAANLGLRTPTLLERIKIGTTNLVRHISRFFAIEDIGGPFIFMFFIIGLLSLRKKFKYLYRFFVFWIAFVLFFISYIFMGARSHLIDFNWAIALVVTLGVLFLIDVLSEYFQIQGRAKTILGGLLALLVLYNLVLAGHVLWGRKYDEPHHLRILTYAQEINKLEIADQDVVAVGMGQFKIDRLGYLTGKSMVVFAPETIKKLIKEDKLKVAFDKFNIKYIIGYSDELNKEILANSKVVNVASNSLLIEIPETSRTKSWFMNLVR